MSLFELYLKIWFNHSVALMLFLLAPKYLYYNLTLFDVLILRKKHRPVRFFVVTHETAQLSIGGAKISLGFNGLLAVLPVSS